MITVKTERICVICGEPITGEDLRTGELCTISMRAGETPNESN
jgi:hypothetical protein